MAFNVKDEQVVENLRELARLQGTSMSTAVATAIKQQLEDRRRSGTAARILQLAEEIRAQPEFTLQTNEESDLEMYDNQGLPK